MSEYVPYEPIALEAHGMCLSQPAGTCWAAEALAFSSVPVTAAFCLPVGTERCCRQRAVAREVTPLLG